MDLIRVIETKEVQIVLHRSARQARRKLNLVRAKYGKQRHQPVTVQEFCEYFKFRIEDIYERLKWK